MHADGQGTAGHSLRPDALRAALRQNADRRDAGGGLQSGHQGERRHLQPHPGLGRDGRMHAGQWRPRLRVLPGLHARRLQHRAEIRQSEPYVQGQTTYSTFSPRPGNTRTSWLTGAAAWSYFSATQYILGIRPELDGLRLDPCIPSTWSGFTATRRFRSQTFNIEVHNPDGVCSGIARMTVDGKSIPGNLIPLDLPGTEHHIEAWMGK